MKIDSVNNKNTTFGYSMPKKKTYRAMKGFYEIENNKSMAVEYGMLHHEAMSKLHYRKFQKAEQELKSFSKAHENKKMNFKEVSELIKIYGKIAYEKLASVRHYYAGY